MYKRPYAAAMADDSPAIPGYQVSTDGTTQRARRRGALTAAQIEYGCKAELSADSLAELEVACVAERIKLTIVTAAEDLARQMTESSDDGHGLAESRRPPGDEP